MSLRANVGRESSLGISGPKISANIDDPRDEMDRIGSRGQRSRAKLDTDLGNRRNHRSNAVDEFTPRDERPYEEPQSPRRKDLDRRTKGDNTNRFHNISDGEPAPFDDDPGKRLQKKWKSAEEVNRDSLKKRFHYKEIPYEKIFPRDENISKCNYQLTPENNLLTKTVAERKARLGSGNRSRIPRTKANRIGPTDWTKKVRDYKDRGFEPKLHKYSTVYTYDRCNSPYSLNYLNSKGFSHSIPDPRMPGFRPALERHTHPPPHHSTSSSHPHPTTFRGDPARVTMQPVRGQRSRRLRRGKTSGGCCCCSGGDVEVEEHQQQQPKTEHHSLPSAPEFEADPIEDFSPRGNGYPSTPIIVSPQYTPRHPSPPKITTRSMTPPAIEAKVTPRATLHPPKPLPHQPSVVVPSPIHPIVSVHQQPPARQIKTPPIKTTPRQRHRATCCTCCSDSDVDVTDSMEPNSPRRRMRRRGGGTCGSDSDVDVMRTPSPPPPPPPPPPEVYHRTLTPEVDLHLRKPEAGLNIQTVRDPHQQIPVKTPPKASRKAFQMPSPDLRFYIPKPKFTVPKPKFTVSKPNFTVPKPKFTAPKPKFTISKPSLHLARPRTDYRMKTPPKLTFKRPKLGPIKPISMNLPTFRRTKKVEVDAVPKTQPRDKNIGVKMPGIKVKAERPRVSEAKIQTRPPPKISTELKVKNPAAPTASMEAPHLKKTFEDLQIKDPRLAANDWQTPYIQAPAIDFHEPDTPRINIGVDNSRIPGSRPNTPEFQMPRAEIRSDIPRKPLKPIREGVTAVEPHFRPIETDVRIPKADIRDGVPRPKMRPIETDIEVSEPPSLRPENRGVSLKPKDTGIRVSEPDLSLSVPGLNISGPNTQRPESPTVSVNSRTPEKLMPLDGPKIKPPKVTPSMTRPMVNPTFADLQIIAPRPEPRLPQPRIHPSELRINEPSTPRADIVPSPDDEHGIRRPNSSEHSKPRFQAESPDSMIGVPRQKPRILTPEERSMEPSSHIKGGVNPRDDFPASKPTYYPPSDELQTPRRDGNKIYLPRLPKPRSSVPVKTGLLKVSTPPRIRDPPEHRSPPSEPPQIRKPPEQKQPPPAAPLGQNPSGVEPLKWRLRQNPESRPSHRGMDSNRGQDVDPGLTYYPPSRSRATLGNSYPTNNRDGPGPLAPPAPRQSRF